MSEHCELCEAVPFTEWFHDDGECWIAECESCAVPMVVWRTHDPSPDEATRARLHERLTAVMSNTFDGRWWIDDHLRTIPDHYHAHARPYPGTGLRRR